MFFCKRNVVTGQAFLAIVGSLFAKLGGKMGIMA
jgi:hypothetical protein